MPRDATTKDLTVTPTGDSVVLRNGVGTAAFHVTNNSGLPFLVRVEPNPLTPPPPSKIKPAVKQWLSVAGSDRFQLGDGESHDFAIQVDASSASKTTADQTYMFSLTAVSHEAPEAHWGESDPVVFTVLAPKPPKIPWPLIAAAVVLLILIGVGAIFLFNR